MDKGKSGDSLNRPAFERLQAAVFAGEVGTVVAYKLDGLSRSLLDGVNTLAGWCEKAIRVVATSQGLDFNGPLGKMLAPILFGIAEMEQETRRERQAAGIDVAKKAGKYRGRKVGTTKAKPELRLETPRPGIECRGDCQVAGCLAEHCIRLLAQGQIVGRSESRQSIPDSRLRVAFSLLPSLAKTRTFVNAISRHRD